jgi:hypothetical protein
MALVKCHECGHSISNKAPRCPHCGVKRRTPTSFVTKMAAGFIAFSVLIGVIGAITAEHDAKKTAQAEAARRAGLTPEQKAAEAQAAKAKKTADAEAEALMSAVYTCRMFIRQRLKDPESVKWAHLGDETPRQKNKDGSFTADLSLRARNSFGGLVLETYQCQVRQAGDDWRLMRLDKRD